MSSEALLKIDKLQLLREHDTRAEGIGKAAWQLEDAMRDRLIEEYPSDLKARQLHFEVCAADVWFNRALKVLIVITIFETPAWCNTDDFFSFIDASERCSIEGVHPEHILLSNLPYLPPGLTVAVEVVMVFIIARKLFLDMKLQNWFFKPLNMTYKNVRVLNFGLAMAALELIDCVIFVTIRPNWRLAFIARTGFFCILPQIQSLFNCIIKVVHEIFSIAGFLVMTMVFFGWVSVTIFDDLTDIVYGEPVNKGLDTLGGTIYTMFVAGTTDDFIACFLPTYTLYRPAGILWFVFLIIVQVLLLNLVLDTLVAAYMSHSEETEEEVIKDKTQGVVRAFKTLSEATGEIDITKQTFLEFVAEFSKSPSVRPISANNADVIFRAVDEDKSGLVDCREFLEICRVIQYDFWTTKKDSPVKDHFPGLWANPHFARFREHVYNGDFDRFMNYVLLVNLLLVVNESIYDVYGWQETKVMENLELIFSFIYVCEVGLILSVESFKQYWSSRSNQFDFFTTWLLLGSSILDELASSSAGANVKRYMNILRLLRLLRVIKQLKRLKAVQFMVQTISALVMASRDILSLLGVVVYFFATLSVQLWGGLMYDTNPLLEHTEYKKKNYFVLNFNDFMMAVGVWWVSLLCEYVRCFPDAIWEVSPMPWTWVVFPIFYVTGVSIIFELVKAFTIEMFLALNKERDPETGGLKEEDSFECLETLKKMFVADGLELQHRVVGDTSLHQKMREALEEFEEEMKEKEQHEHGYAAKHEAEHGH